MRSSRGISVRTCLCCVLVVALTSNVQAQDQPTQNQPTQNQPSQNQTETVQERAELLFNQALVLMKSDHCQDAIPLFGKSQELDPAAATLVNLATCYDRVGKSASAYVTYQQASRAAILEGKPELQKRTEQAMATLAPTLTRLRVVPLGDASARTIRVNGALVRDLREPILLDPGENVIEAIAPGREAWHRTLSTPPAGALLVIEVPELRAVPNETQTVSRPTTKPAPLAGHTSTRGDSTPWILLGAGISAASFAVSAGFALSANSKYDDSNPHCAGNSCTKQGGELREQAGSRADIATLAFGVGLVSAATAGVLWLTSRQKEPPPKVGIQPWILPSQGAALAGVLWRGEL